MHLDQARLIRKSVWVQEKQRNKIHHLYSKTTSREMPRTLSCDKYDLTISTKKTEVVYQPVHGKPYSEPTITVNAHRLHVFDKFTYLGGALQRAVNIDDEVTARTAKASVVFGRLRRNVSERNTLS